VLILFTGHTTDFKTYPKVDGYGRKEGRGLGTIIIIIIITST
jgi:hypothetical protein